MPITIRAGDKVVIRGLQRNTALNGELATVQSSQGERIIVHLADGQAKALKLDNLRVPYAWCHGCAAAQVYDKQDTQSRCSVCREDFVEELLTYQDYVDSVSFIGRAPTLSRELFNAPTFVGRNVRIRPTRQARPVHPFMQFSANPSMAPQPIQAQPNISINIQANNNNNDNRPAPAPQAFSPFEMLFQQLQQQQEDMTPVSRGASKAAIEALETVPQSEMKADDSCPVCQDDFKEGEEEAVVKMPCGHAFHKECLLPWLESNNTCPTCRHEIPSVHSDPNASESERAAHTTSRVPQPREAGSPLSPSTMGDGVSFRFQPYVEERPTPRMLPMPMGLGDVMAAMLTGRNRN